jgi:hypothetical protein
VASLGFGVAGVLDVNRDDHAGDGAGVERHPHGAVDEMRGLGRVHAGVDELGDIAQQGLQVDLLEPFRAERDALLLTHQGDNRLVVELRVVEPVEELDGTGARGGDADARLAGELGVRACRVSRDHLVADLDELGLPAELAKRAHESRDAVARVAVDALGAPLPVQPGEHELGDGRRQVLRRWRPRRPPVRRRPRWSRRSTARRSGR